MILRLYTTANNCLSDIFTYKKIMAPIPLLALGLSAVGQGFSSYMASLANKEAENILNRRVTDLESALKFNENSNFLNSTEAAGSLQKLRDQMRDIAKRNERNALRTNQTTEAQVATQDAANKNYARSVSDLAMYGNQKKEANAFRYKNMLSSLYDRQIGVQQAKRQNWNQLGQNIGNMTGTFLEAFNKK